MLLGSEKRTADMRGAYGDTLVELGKDRVAHRPALVKLRGAEEAQEARLHLAVALRLHVHIHDADARIALEAVEDGAARALEIGEVLSVEHDHRALRPHHRPAGAVDGKQQRIAVIPGGGDEGDDGSGEGQ